RSRARAGRGRTPRSPRPRRSRVPAGGSARHAAAADTPRPTPARAVARRVRPFRPSRQTSTPLCVAFVPATLPVGSEDRRHRRVSLAEAVDERGETIREATVIDLQDVLGVLLARAR